ncbi:MAG: PKD domain-containing protein, partial [Luteibaculum sp.]
KTSGCTPLEVGFIPQSSGTNTYYWQFEPGAGEQNTGSSVSYEYVNIGSSPVSRTPRLIIENEFSCRDTTFGQVTIFPPVRAQAAFSDTGCAPFFVNFFNVSSGANSYLWDFGAFGSSALASPKILFDVDDSVYRNFPFSLIASSSFGCRDTFVDDVTIHPTPQASFTRSPAAGCQPLNVSFSNTSRGASSFIWDYGLGERDSLDQLSFQKEFSNETLGIQNRPLQLVAVNTYGCRDTVGASLQVFPKIEAKFDSVPSGCSPHVITVVNESVGESILNWSFSSGDADNGNSVARQFDNTTPNDQNHWVELIATNGQGCKDTLRRDFVVYGNPIAQFNADPTFQKFPSSTVNFTNTTAGLNWTYEWDFGDTSAIVNTRDASNTYDYWGTYRVRLKAFSSQCSDSAFINVVIDPPAPVADFIGGGEGCRPLTLSFADLSQFANNYFWDFGDGGSTNTPNPTYTFYNPGVYTVSLVVTGPDGSSSRHEIPQAVEVYENASAFFTSSPSTVFADEDPVDFVNLSTGADFYTWDFGDGNKSTEESPSHFYSAPGTYDVQLIADNEFGCADTFVVNNSIRVVVGGFIDVPNAFSPSPSGPTGGFYDPNSLNNDVFFAFNKDVIQFKMEIFTRWGEKIFESRDVNIGWDGYSDGTLCQQDVYVYKIVATFEDGQTFEQIGDVTLLR